ncbi:MAG: carbohydrate ABC transporter permease, partial [Hyphomicrobiales bacterium]
MIGRRPWIPWLWLSPALILLGVFLVYPVIDTFRRSLLDARSDNWVGFDNYRFIIDNPQPLVADTHAAIFTNILWLVLFPLIVVPLGLVLAVLTSRVRYEAVAKSAIFIPMAISFVAAAVIWKFMYEFNPRIGTLNSLLTEAGRDPIAWLQNMNSPQTWLTDAGPQEAWGPIQINNFALIGVAVWMWTGFSLVVLSAALKGISTEILEAARVDGANEWQIFRR